MPSNRRLILTAHFEGACAYVAACTPKEIRDECRRQIQERGTYSGSLEQEYRFSFTRQPPRLSAAVLKFGLVNTSVGRRTWSGGKRSLATKGDTCRVQSRIPHQSAILVVSSIAVTGKVICSKGTCAERCVSDAREYTVADSQKSAFPNSHE